MGGDLTRFCVSWVTMWVMRAAIVQFIQAWNCHRIPGPNGGVPNTLACNSATTTLAPNTIPSTAEMIQIHERDGARLTRDSQFGRDLLCDYPSLQALRDRDFHILYPNHGDVFENIVHSNGQPSYFTLLTRRFASLLP